MAFKGSRERRREYIAMRAVVVLILRSMCNRRNSRAIMFVVLVRDTSYLTLRQDGGHSTLFHSPSWEEHQHLVVVGNPPSETWHTVRPPPQARPYDNMRPIPTVSIESRMQSCCGAAVTVIHGQRMLPRRSLPLFDISLEGHEHSIKMENSQSRLARPEEAEYPAELYSTECSYRVLVQP